MNENIYDILWTIITTLANLLFENKVSRIICKSLLYLFLIASIVILFYALLNVNDLKQKDYILNSILPITFIPAIFLTLLYGAFIASKLTNAVDSQLENLRKERVEITHKMETDNKLDIFHTIQLSLNQLNEYYTINKAQARSSFRFSIFSIVFGLITILVGVWLNYFGNKSIELTFITGVSGVILEFIGGAYFFMYKKSLEQVNFFFGQLIKIQDTMLSINLANNISEEIKRVEMHEKIIISLLERSLK
ncbi:hypothetical protein VT569_10160 [Flavobacterium psychrophilum]|uniref:TRADD-N-associated membrane domain-containing protein n=1 Tax=Flavobacterium psychrophilum TaxID=96345 RepID=UPI000B7C5480|nr:hypothetical protein [Flavobacterium psychrophilum]ELY2011225.1 hypothetical protein [Flavobacterium psychrophilum]SNB09609.1 conserved membrane hypothetical protein [Flavobacterium psychrophilum]